MTQTFKKDIRRRRGGRTHGYGRITGHRGVGCRGGHGVAPGKFKHHFKHTLVQKNLGYPEHQKGFPKHGNPWRIGFKGFVLPPEVARRKAVYAINICDLNEMVDRLVDQKLAIKEGNIYKVDLKAININKLLSKGTLTKKCEISVKFASKKAIEKVEAAGSKVILTAPVKEEKPEPKEE